MSAEKAITALFVLLLILAAIGIRSDYKVRYYEAILQDSNIDISRVQNMAWYKLWVD
ncbi:hypothetical protein KAR91_35845 [Candidatus Pacearchaeota archaeon]|nr:hypothetical protein [Candidatus Pacearchaeota archaeon]